MNDVGDIKRKSVKGVLALTTRTAFLQIVSLIGNFLLTIFLSPAEFGIYFIVSSIVVFLNYFSDIGLAAALIQKQEITDKDLSSTFTIQQIFVLGFSILAFILSRPVASFYHLTGDGMLLYQCLIIAFIFSSLKTIPSILLERKLDFQKLVIPQFFEVAFFYLVAVILAYMGWGIRSFTLAVLVRAVVGTIVIYIVMPWKIRIAIHRESIGKLLKFGIPFQLNSFLALVKDDLFTLYLGKMLPFAYVGYIGWAKKWAELPLRLIMDSVVRVTFPAYSRLQNDHEKLSKGIKKTIFFIMLFIVPISIGMVSIIVPFIHSVPRYEKWNPAVVSFFLFVLSSAIAALSTPLINVLNALGKIKITLKLMVVWTLLTWILSPLLVHLFGFNGFAFSSVIISLTVFGVVWISKKYVSYSLRSELVPSLLCGLVMGICIYVVKPMIPETFIGIFAIIIIGIISYTGAYLLLFRHKIQREFTSILNVLKSKP